MNQTDYAIHAGVDRKTIGRWIKKGLYIVFDGDDIDVEKTDRALAMLRDSKDGRTTNAVRNKKTPATRMVESDDEPDPLDVIIQNDAGLSLEEARRIKENYLAALTRLEYQQKEGELVEMSVAEEVLFSAFRQQRDSWLNWPSRVAPLMAADLGVPAERMTEVLVEHVHKHISVLGEPEFNPGEE